MLTALNNLTELEYNACKESFNNKECLKLRLSECQTSYDLNDAGSQFVYIIFLYIIITL